MLVSSLRMIPWETHSVMLEIATASTYFSMDFIFVFIYFDDTNMVQFLQLVASLFYSFVYLFYMLADVYYTFPYFFYMFAYFPYIFPLLSTSFCFTFNTHLAVFSTVGTTLNTYLLTSNIHLVILSQSIILTFLHFDLLVVTFGDYFNMLAYASYIFAYFQYTFSVLVFSICFLLPDFGLPLVHSALL